MTENNSRKSIKNSKSLLNENDSDVEEGSHESFENSSKFLSEDKNSFASHDEPKIEEVNSEYALKENSSAEDDDESKISKESSNFVVEENSSVINNDSPQASIDDFESHAKRNVFSKDNKNDPVKTINHSKSSFENNDSGKDDSEYETSKVGMSKTTYHENAKIKRKFTVPSELLNSPSHKAVSLDDFFPGLNNSPKISLKSDDSQERVDNIKNVPQKSKVDRQVSFKTDKVESKEMLPATQEDDDASEEDFDQTQISKGETIESKQIEPDTKKPEEYIYTSKQPPKRPSYVRRKVIAMEKELSFDNINRKVTRMSLDTSKKVATQLEDKNVAVPKRNYLSTTMATIFLISVYTGVSMSSLPYYLRESNWFGVFFLLLLGLNAMYAGLCFGWSWSIMEDMWPEYLEYSRIPYQDIASKAAGKFMKYFVAFNIDVSVLAICGTYIILIADSLEKFTYPPMHFCILVVIITVLLLPFTMFASYRNMKFIGVTDILLCVLFIFFLMLGIFLDKPRHGTSAYNNPTFASLVSSIGGLSFSYGIGATIPTVLMDMNNRGMFTHSIATANLCAIVIYVLIAIMGYAAYGNQTETYISDHILSNQKYRPLGIFIQILYLFELMTTFVCFLLPILLQFEVRVNCPDRFGLFRFLLRFTILLCLLLLIFGFPNINNYLAIVGGTSINLLTFVFPPVFYVCLVYQQSRKSRRHISKKEWLLIIETILVGVILALITIWKSYEMIRPSDSRHSSCFANITIT